MRRATIAAGILIAVSVTAAAGWQPLSTPPGSTAIVVERFLQRDDAPLQSYRAYRRLEARNRRFKAEGWMEVTTEFSAATGLQWTVQREGGSRYIRQNVLRKALEAEVTAFRTGGPLKAALNDVNYAFGDLHHGEDDTVSVGLAPRRRDVLLISGVMVLSNEDGDLREVAGRLSKSPSFWTHAVDIVRRYGRRNGIRVPVSMSSTANVRVAGVSEFLMTYEYESVNGEPVSDSSSSPKVSAKSSE